MTITTVRRGDIVEIDKNGRLFFAVVTARRRSGLEILPITAGISFRSCVSREVVGHYRRSKNSRVPAVAA
jgi:antitoxin (DNA-binding transcriptional repressor) of toxin-antitoxin stability system